MSVVKYSWRYGGLIAAEASHETADVDILDAILSEWHGLEVTQLSTSQLSALQEGLTFAPLYLVLKRDEEETRMSAGEWHTEASGKRSRPCWWIDESLLESVTDELEAEK